LCIHATVALAPAIAGDLAVDDLLKRAAKIGAKKGTRCGPLFFAGTKKAPLDLA
jgi:hypothetical protein